MRKEWLDYSLKENDDEKFMQRTRLNAPKVQVSAVPVLFYSSRLISGDVQECVKAWMATLVSSFAIHAIIILFGAPATM